MNAVAVAPPSQQINLFNPGLLRQKRVFTARTMLAALGLLLFGSLALLAYGQHSVQQLSVESASGAERLNQTRRRHAQAMVDFAPRQKSAAVERALAEAEAELAGLNEVTAALGGDQMGNTTGYSGYFKALARQSAGDLWLTGVTISAGGRMIGLRGRAMDAALVPAYVKRLAREPVMQGKDFGSLAITRAVLTATPGSATATATTGTATAAPEKPPELAPYIDFVLQSSVGQSSSTTSVKNGSPAAAVPAVRATEPTAALPNDASALLAAASPVSSQARTEVVK